MRFLADENMPGGLVAELRELGHDVAWIRSDAPGASDDVVLALAVREGRVLLTFDKDFGDLARAANLPLTLGIVLFRVPAPLGAEAKAIARLLASRDDWVARFSVIEPGRVCMRSLR